MIKNDVAKILSINYPVELVESTLSSYENALSEYQKGHWQYFGNEIGQFVEIVRRMIEYQLTSIYTPLENKLPNFNEKVLIAWENSDAKISEVYRIIIPRCLYSMYCIRNKRGMIHKNKIDPNKMDATVLLSNAKWVLAELFRQVSSLSFNDTAEIIDSIIVKNIDIAWKVDNTLRILDNKLSSKNKILCLLYIQDRMSDVELQKAIEYKNSSDFKKILKSLHKDRLIEYSTACILSPLGIIEAEKILSDSDYKKP